MRRDWKGVLCRGRGSLLPSTRRLSPCCTHWPPGPNPPRPPLILPPKQQNFTAASVGRAYWSRVALKALVLERSRSALHVLLSPPAAARSTAAATAPASNPAPGADSDSASRHSSPSTPSADPSSASSTTAAVAAASEVLLRGLCIIAEAYQPECDLQDPVIDYIGSLADELEMRLRAAGVDRGSLDALGHLNTLLFGMRLAPLPTHLCTHISLALLDLFSFFSFLYANHETVHVCVLVEV
jgi:hypothetical protein